MWFDRTLRDMVPYDINATLDTKHAYLEQKLLQNMKWVCEKGDTAGLKCQDLTSDESRQMCRGFNFPPIQSNSFK